MRILPVISFVLCFAIFLHAENRKPLTFDEVLQLKFPTTFTVSPDEHHLVFTIREADFENSEWHTHLWRIDRAGTNIRQLTFGSSDEYAPRYDPQGRWIAFLSNRKIPDNDRLSGTTQLWALPAKGGEPQYWTSLTEGVDDYRWSASGQFIYLIAPEPAPEAAQQAEEQRKKRKFDAEVRDSVVVSKALWQLEVSSRELKKVAELDPGVREFDISRDGRFLVYETNYTGKYDDEQKYDLWVVNLSTGEKWQLTDFPGPEYQPKFSPDGSYVFYRKQTTPDIEFAETDLARISFVKNSSRVDTLTLTKDFDRAVTDFVFGDNSDWLIFEAAEGVETHLYRFRWKRNQKRYEKLTENGSNNFQVKIQNRTVYFLNEGPYSLPEISFLNKGKTNRITKFSETLKAFQLGEQSVFRWRSVDGKEIEGLLIKPVNFDPDQKYPLILTVHGGPYGRFRNVFRQYYNHQVFANQGYVLLAPNPRGSSGYDDAFGKAIWHKRGGHMGGIDYQDIMAGVDALLREGFVDEKRMGVIGGSYGGYMTNWIITQTDRFSAAVSLFGIFSLFTDWSNSWQPSWEKMYLGIYYWEELISAEHPYVKYSPAFYVQNIRTPVLILHGERDRYTNLANSQEMYQALKTLGREVEFVVYPREGHGIGREPNHRRDVFRRALKWFNKYLKVSKENS